MKNLNKNLSKRTYEQCVRKCKYAQHFVLLLKKVNTVIRHFAYLLKCGAREIIIPWQSECKMALPLWATVSYNIKQYLPQYHF